MTARKRSVFVFDPAWNTDNGGGGRGAQNHYALSSVDAIAASYRMSPQWETEGDALVFIWATRSAWREGDAPILARMLGLELCSDFVWSKIDVVPKPESIMCSETLCVCGRCGADLFRPPAMMGLGFWSRSEHEYLLVGRRGDVDVPPPALRPRSVIYAPRVVDTEKAAGVANKTVHSAKPQQAWDQVIEPIARAVMPGVVGIEFNCRRRRRGWSAVGRLDGEDKPIRFERCPDAER